MAKQKKTAGKMAAPMILRVPRELRDAFKAACARNGQSMTAALLGFMTEVSGVKKHS